METISTTTRLLIVLYLDAIDNFRLMFIGLSGEIDSLGGVNVCNYCRFALV